MLGSALSNVLNGKEVTRLLLACLNSDHVNEHAVPQKRRQQPLQDDEEIHREAILAKLALWSQFD